MDIINNFLNNNFITIILLFINIIIFILYFNSYIKLKKYKMNNELIIKKLGNGRDILEILNENNKKIEDIELINKEIKKYIEELEKKTDNCMQKIGFVRYNAFKDTGSELSFALALLNKSNTGIILNGIYSRETSNIYAKSIENGKSEYRLSEEETIALNEALQK
ncbi:MAG: DUF4446 family protein [Clostridia bacterium]|nr:DUF4446 family protein [Clostridia bacterium]